MPPTLRTATITTLTGQFQSVQTLLIGKIAGKTKHYENAVLENEGDVNIYVSVVDDSTQNPSQGDSKTVLPGQQLKFKVMDTSFTYIATSDVGSTNQVGMYGDPVFGL